MIKYMKLRFNLDKEADRTAYDYLKHSALSESKTAISTINEYLRLIEEKKAEDSFLDRVATTIQDNLKALVPLLNLLNATAQPVQEKEPPAAEQNEESTDEMLDFLDGF